MKKCAPVGRVDGRRHAIQGSSTCEEGPQRQLLHSLAVDMHSTEGCSGVHTAAFTVPQISQKILPFITLSAVTTQTVRAAFRHKTPLGGQR